MNRRADRDAAIAASLEDLEEERELQEAEADAYAQAQEEDEERRTKQRQEDILRQYRTADYDSLDEWQKALRQAGFYYESLEGYAAVVKHPDAYFGSYEDMGDPWITHEGAYVIPGVGVFVDGHLVGADDVSDLTGRYGDGPDEEHPVFTPEQLVVELFGDLDR